MFNGLNPPTPKRGQTPSVYKAEEEDLLEQDVEDKRTKHRRNELRLNYDEDSSDEDYDKTKQEKPEVNEEEEDEDMFKSDNEEEEEETKQPDADNEAEFKFTNIDKFNEQIANELALDQNSGLEAEKDMVLEDEEEEESVDASYYIDPESFDSARPKPKFDPKIEAFNLKEEASEGRFDIDGNFIRNEDAEEDKEDEKDSWYSEYSKKADIEKTRRAQEERDFKLKQSLVAKKVTPIEDLLTSMINHLDSAETPMEKLQSLSKKLKSKKQRRQQGQDSKEEAQRRQKVEEITSLANELISKGRIEIYDETREQLIRLYKEETGTDFVLQRGSKRMREEAQYEFMYIDDDQIHGPYSLEEMIEWRDEYFEGNVLVRAIGDDNFIKIDDFNFED